MILAPFKWIVALFFNWSNALFNDPGWAVVGMSVLLSLLLTPLYIWIERRKNSDRAKSAPMQAEIDKIEAVYSGRERFYYTREIQRRYHYSPWTAMIPTLGLLVQIPFLLAAYHYLSELPIFNGASFWYIKDLSKPDTIATFAGLPINLLAILMTVINLVSGWRYAESGKPKERIQYMAVAAIFLVLLYNCAASVVLYWTLSNALSLVRSEVFFRKQSRGLKVQVESVAVPKQNFLLSESFFSVAWFSIVAVACYCLSVGFFIDGKSTAMRQLASRMDFFGVCFLGLALIVLVYVGLLRNNFSMLSGKNFLSDCRRFVGWSVVALFAVMIFDRFTDFPISSSPILDYIAARACPMAGVLIVLEFVLSFRTLRRMLDEVLSYFYEKKLTIWPSLVSFLYLVGLIVVWHPMLVYASEPQSFSTSAWKMVFSGMLWTAAAAIGWFLLWRICPKGRSRSALTALIIWCAVVSLVYLFILPIDVGTLQGAELVNAEGIVRSPYAYIFDAIALVMIFVVVIGLINRFALRVFVFAFALLYVVVMFQAIVKCISVGKHASQDIAEVANDKDNSTIRLSRKHNNIVVFLLDMVQGNSFTNVYADAKLAAGLDGFVWYPNSVSIANMTCPSMPAIYGGPEYSPKCLNADSGRLLNDKALSAIRDLNDRFAKEGFRFVHYNCNRVVFMNDFMRISPLYDRNFLSDLMGRPDYHGKPGELGILRCNALLQACPLLLKPYIYNDGKWRWCGISSKGAYQSFAQEHMFYEALPRLTNVNDDAKEGFFNFFHVEVTHNPWGIPTPGGEDCENGQYRYSQVDDDSVECVFQVDEGQRGL